MAKMNVAKATLGTGKVVYLRMMKIGDTELAAQAASPRSNGDSNVLQILMQKELVKLLLVKVDEKELSASDKEDLDALFTVVEYGQVMQVVSAMTGGDELGKFKPQLEVVASGDK